MKDRANYAKKVASEKAAKEAEIAKAKAKAEISQRARQQLPEGQAAAVDRESFIAAG